MESIPEYASGTDFLYMKKNTVKYYGCSSRRYAAAKIVEEWFDFKTYKDCSFKGYFGDCEKAMDCFRNWVNYRGVIVGVSFYLKVSNRWVEVVHKNLDKDSKDFINIL